jgi:hypothetical protein
VKGIDSINIDICILLESCQKIGWKHLKKESIHRILYLINVLFSFKYEDENNPFYDSYEFSIDLNGPHCLEIERSLLFLETNEVIGVEEDSYFLISKNIPKINTAPDYNLRNEWIKTIVYILGVYGENKIYDFVFEDPEYQYKLLANNSNSLNLDSNNETTQSLKSFKEAFENSLSADIDIKSIDNQKYLTLYFDYVFSKIIKGEDINV